MAEIATRKSKPVKLSTEVEQNEKRKQEEPNFKEDLTEQEIYQAIRDVIIDYLEKNPKSAYKLSQELGLSEHVIPDFIKPGSKKQSIGSDAIISLADYLNMSLDVMVGRIVRIKEE